MSPTGPPLGPNLTGFWKPRQSPLALIERAGTARLTTHPNGTLSVLCSTADERWADALATTIPTASYRADPATVSVLVDRFYAPIARALALRYFADIIETVIGE